MSHIDTICIDHSHLPQPCHSVHPPQSLTVLSLTSISICFIPWPTEINQGNLWDLVFRCPLEPGGLSPGHTTKDRDFPSPGIFLSESVYSYVPPLPSLSIELVLCGSAIGNYNFELMIAIVLWVQTVLLSDPWPYPPDPFWNVPQALEEMGWASI